MPKHDHLHTLPIIERYPEGVWKAINFAARAHETQIRKMSGKHYIEHPFGVLEIVRTVTSDESTHQAAVLHDTVEDTTVTFDDLRNEFGDAVARQVWGVTKDDEIAHWRPRNEAYLQRLEFEAPDGSILVALSDKMHNITDMIASFEAYGDRMWDKFSAKADDQLWWYTSVLDIGKRRLPNCPLNDALEALIMIFVRTVVDKTE